MADSFRRWDGTQWVYVATVNHMGGGGGGAELNIFTGLIEPLNKYGVWFKTEHQITDSIIEVFINIGEGTWSNGSNMIFGSRLMASASVGDNVYVFGGVNQTSQTRIYNTITDTWSSGSDMIYGDHSMAAASVGDNVYVVGRTSSNARTRIYNTTTDTWSSGTSYGSIAMYRATATSVGSNVYVCGGTDGSSQIRIYNTTTDTWSSGTNYESIANHFPTAASVGSNVYVCGGSTAISQTRIYNTTTDTWSSGSDMPIQNTGYSAGASFGSNVYVFGGLHADSKTATLIYNTTTDIWSSGSDMIYGDEQLAGAIVDNKIYICGGALYPSATRIYILPKSLEYAEYTAVVLTGKATNDTETNVTKILDNVNIFIEEAWIFENGLLNSYETYIGNGEEWILFKEAN